MKNKIIAVCGTRLYEENTVNFLDALLKKVSDKGFVVAGLSFTTESPEDNKEVMGELSLVNLLDEINPAAIVIMSESIKNQTIINSIKEKGIINHIPVFSIERKEKDCINILNDYKKGFESIVLHVIKEHKVSDIVMLAGFKGNQFSLERVDVFRKTLKENGLNATDDDIYYGDFWEVPARKAITEMIEKRKRIPEAIICANDAMAITACNVLFEHGYRVPEDVIVTGFDGTESASLSIPSISTVSPDYEKEADIIYDVLCSSKKQAKKTDVFNISYKIRQYESCGCKKHNEAEFKNNYIQKINTANDSSWHTYEMNRMLLNISTESGINKLIDILPQVLKLWNNIYMHGDINLNIFTNDLADNRKQTILHNTTREFDTRKNDIFEGKMYPEFDELVSDNKYKFIFIRLLNTKDIVYGKLIEAFPSVDKNDLKRCNETGMSLSSAINLISNNHRLSDLNNTLSSYNNTIKKFKERDYLTGLYSRRGFLKTLKLALKATENLGKTLTIIAADIDNLKFVNDNYGYEEGDFLIKAVGVSLTYLAGNKSICSRYGGDEYICAIISENIEKIYNSNENINDILYTVNGMKEKKYKVHISLGYAKIKIDADTDYMRLITEAEEEMYNEKNKIKSMRIHF